MGAGASRRWLARTTLIPFLALGVIVLAAGAPVPDLSDDTASLAGTSWVLSSLAGEAAPADNPVTLGFEPGFNAGGFDGCNNYRTRYTADGNNIAFGPVAGTLMACPDPATELSQAYQRALAATATYQISVDGLLFSDADGNEVAGFTAQDDSLAGTTR